MIVVYKTTFGHGQDADLYNESLKNLKEFLRIMNTHLQGKQYLVGNNLTVADLTAAINLTIPFQVALDPGFRKAMPNVTSWFERIISLPEFVKRCGKVKLCQKTIKPIFPPKEEKKPIAKPAKKEAGEGEEEEKP